jgi:hypothetical protein
MVETGTRACDSRELNLQIKRPHAFLFRTAGLLLPIHYTLKIRV